MGKPTGFKEFKREIPQLCSPSKRIQHFGEFSIPLPTATLREQGARCMDCGIPFCHAGCPLGNLVPDFNDLVYRNDWEDALALLHSTNNFPEFTGRICPAPCEESCVLSINEPAVTIKNIELTIIERAFDKGWIKPRPQQRRTKYRVAIVGSGPAGLACADQLNRAGHTVTVFERSDRIGGLLRYGVPDFKLEKSIINRRLQLMAAEGVAFDRGVNVGVDTTAEQLKQDFDAIVLCCGSTKPRDLPIPGRELAGVHQAMEYLPQQNRRVAGDASPVPTKGWWFGDHRDELTATDNRVIVIGGGDTGADCVGTANRQGATFVTQFELLPKPPQDRPQHQPWPYWPQRLRTSSSHEEGCNRRWAIQTKRFNGHDGKLVSLDTIDVEWTPPQNGSGPQTKEIPGTEKNWPADLVLLALGFTGPETNGIVSQLNLNLDERHNVATDNEYMTNNPGVFACGDMRRGQSLIVWAISEGREAARSVDRYLTGSTQLPTKGEGDLM